MPPLVGMLFNEIVKIILHFSYFCIPMNEKPIACDVGDNAIYISNHCGALRYRGDLSYFIIS